MLRPAEKADSRAIHRLIHEVGINPLGLHWPRFLVMTSKAGDLLGCGQVKLHGDGSKEVASIAVVASKRGQGIAHAIIRELLARESQRPLYLMCRAGLEKFYEKFGFHSIEFEEMPPYFRKISRAERLFNRDALPEDRLRVMRLE